jgi:hypothetical protein
MEKTHGNTPEVFKLNASIMARSRKAVGYLKLLVGAESNCPK